MTRDLSASPRRRQVGGPPSGATERLRCLLSCTHCHRSRREARARCTLDSALRYAAMVALNILALLASAALTERPILSRRSALAGFTGAALSGGLTSSLVPAVANAAVLEPTASYSLGVSKPEAGRDFFEVILPPVRGRATVRTAIGRGEGGDGMWGFEQLLLFQNVSATIRMTAIRLDDGTLWINAPVAPTGECLALLKELGEVSHVRALHTL